MNVKNRYMMIMVMALLCSCVVLTSITLAYENDPSFAGEWSGAISLPGQELGLHVHLSWKDGQYQGSVDIPLQGAMGIPLESFEVDDEEISFALAGIPGDPKLDLHLSQDGLLLTGLFNQGGASFPVELRKETPEELEVAKKEAQELREQQLEEITTIVQDFLEEWSVPGVGVGIVKNGEVFLAEGFGYADLETQREVTSDTLFAIGSSTKAFATASVALMVEEGELSWDQPVVNYLPWFGLDDDYVTLNVTLRDFALHRSGMTRHDFSWYGREIEREEIIESMKYLELGANLRETFIYNNHGYVLLGYLAGHVAGMEWEDLVQRDFLTPLGMEKTGMTIDFLKEDPDHARPYQSKDGQILPINYRNLDTMGPAGSMNSTVTDMLAWVQLFLNGGLYNEEQILSPMSIMELTLPQVALPTPGFSELRFSNYALGWMVDDYRGDLVVHHGGNIDGYSALVSMVPHQQLGIVVLTNMNNSVLPTLVTYTIMDMMNSRDLVDWSGRLHESISMMPEDMIQTPRQIQGTQPSRDLQQYAGNYEHPGYGDVQIQWNEEINSLEFTFREYTAPLNHWHYDVFAVRLGDIAVGINLPVHFISDAYGFITGLNLPLEATVSPIHFSLVATEELMELSYLESFIGQYEVMGIVLTVRVQHENLVIDIPGQPTQFLLPQRSHRFNFKGLDGFVVDFIEEENEIVGLWLDQPHGSYKAIKID